ncbi:MAG TPA: glycosyltransferase [Planctomycetota bacterium]|nr:glycosyltransferase [Planctomycetota bacterium]
MKVLMLGWEFPPHISGGLGTACFGLTQGLSDSGVEVLFIVPRAYGDEDTSHVRILGANQVPVHAFETEVRTRLEQQILPGFERALALETSSTATLTTEHTATALVEKVQAQVEPLIALLRELGIDSSLLPYQGEDAYVERLRVLEIAGVPAAMREVDTLRWQSREVVETLARTLRDAPNLIEISAQVDELRRSLNEGKPLHFTGSYGSDLMGEVARFALAVGEAARREDFDVIHAHDWMTYPAGIVASRLTGKPLVVHMHACEYDRSGEHINVRIRDMEQLGFDAADRIICVSHYTEKMLLTRYRVDRDRLRVVHNAVTHKEQVAVVHAEKTIPEPIVLFLGRVTFQKGPDYFLEAAARVVKIEPKVKFVISGSGDMLPKMIERAARLGLARHVHFTGFLRGDDVERMYALADIYVMPSVSEPFGISPLEAMALDVPVIVSRQSGVSEVLVSALKVDFWDVQEIANKILGLLRYPALREQLSSDGREEVRRLRWDERARAVLAIYKEVLR